MIQKEQKNTSAIILSAGKSERMGVQKFSLKFDSKITFLEKLIGEYHSFGCDEIIVVLNETSAVLYHQLKLSVPGNVKVVINHHPEWERFYSLKLAALALNEVKPVFVSNIDNPFVTAKTLSTILNSSKDVDYTSPSFNGKGGHPFFISEKVIMDLRSEEQDQTHLKEFLYKYSRKFVDIDDERVLLNINTMEEYKRYFNKF
jgi:CTP:molybdopterin cytidylyltransferase MocA